jgi:hypothetical protein
MEILNIEAETDETNPFNHSITKGGVSFHALVTFIAYLTLGTCFKILRTKTKTELEKDGATSLKP